MAKDTKTAVNRRTDIISAAIEVFAETGYYRTTTAQVAQRARISQPYVLIEPCYFWPGGCYATLPKPSTFQN